MAIVKAYGGGYKFKGDWTKNGGTHFYIGDYYDNNSQFYSSRIQFSWSTENGEGKPIVVKSATLKLYCDNNDDDTSADIYINGVKTERKKAISNTGNSWTSISLNEASCKELSKLNNGNSFYIILDGTSIQPRLGNRYKGFNHSNKPYLDINWVYGASSGKVSGSDFYKEIKLTISPLSSSYTHSIDWQLKRHDNDEYDSIKTIPVSSGSIFSITYSEELAVKNISTYFSSTSKTAKGKVIITTYDGPTKMGDSDDCTFDINLSGDALIEMSSSSFTAVHSEKILSIGTSHFLIDYSYLKYIVTFQSKTGANITKVIPSFSGGVISDRGALVPDSGRIEDTLNIAISKKEKISYSFLVTDSRNMTYTITGDCVSENSISKYSPPIITGGFYRSDESGTESKQGTYLNSNLRVTGENILSNKLKDLTIKIENKNKSTTTLYTCLDASGNQQNTINTNLNNKMSLLNNIFSISSSGYINPLEGEDNLTITVQCKDNIWKDTISSTFSVPSLNYILYFKKGGEGLAFGGSSLSDDTKIVRSYWDLVLQNRLILNEAYPLDIKYGGTGVISEKGIWDKFIKPGGTIDGELIFNKKLLQKGDLWVQNSVLYPQINFIPKRDEVTNRLGTIYLFSRSDNTANDITRSQFNFRQYCFNPDGKTVYTDDYDTFSLPITGSISSAGSHGTKYYQILTTKGLVTSYSTAELQKTNSASDPGLPSGGYVYDFNNFMIQTGLCYDLGQALNNNSDATYTVIKTSTGTAVSQKIATGVVDITITFQKSFSEIPTVISCFNASSKDYAHALVQQTVHSIDKTKFLVRLYNNSSSNRLPNLNWIAIGPK